MPTWGDGAMFMFLDQEELEAYRFDKAVGISQFSLGRPADSDARL